MSMDAMGWAMDQKAGDSQSKLILLLMADNADVDGNYAHGADYLAKHAECSGDDVQRTLAALEKKKLIKLKRGRDGRPAAQLMIDD